MLRAIYLIKYYSINYVRNKHALINLIILYENHTQKFYLIISAPNKFRIILRYMSINLIT